MNDVTALEGRVTRLENAVTDGFSRIEVLLRQEISDLKAEQITELRKALDRTLDDQRRAWDAIRALEQRWDQRQGSVRTLGGLGSFLAVIFGGLVTWLAAFLTAKPPHP